MSNAEMALLAAMVAGAITTAILLVPLVYYIGWITP